MAEKIDSGKERGEPGRERTPPAPKRRWLSLLMVVSVLTLLAAATGGGVGILLASTVEKIVAEKEKDQQPDKQETPLRYTGNMVLRELKPVLTNLASPTSTWVRVEASIIFQNGSLPNPDVAAAEIRDDIMSYVRTLSLNQLEGPSALQHLRDDLNERASLRTEGRVSELVIETFVVQ